MLAYLFPGQGSQKKGMGKTLFSQFPELVQQADAVLGYSIEKLCLEGPAEQLNQTQYTQPALYTVNALSYFQKLLDTSEKPDYVAGHSLGEYNALLAASVFDFPTGLQLVKKRGELMAKARDGGMAAVIGLDVNKINTILQENQLTAISIANFNSPSQQVLSGPQTLIHDAKLIFEREKNTVFIPLKVSGAFHSSYMTDAQHEFAEFLERFQFSFPRIPVLANMDAEPYHPAVIKTNLAQQITQPVNWVKIMQHLLAHANATLEEIGSGNVLTGLLKQYSSQNHH